MQNPFSRGIAVVFTILVIAAVTSCFAQEQPANDPYPRMAPLDQYMMTDTSAEIELARSAAPKSISDSAEVMILGPEGYTTGVKGTNGFLCIVVRSWGASTDDPEFWNPKVRAPICYNAASRNSIVSSYLLKTKLVLAGKSKAEIAHSAEMAKQSKATPRIEPGAMCYMMSKQQYLSDSGKHWHPHLMFFVEGDAASSWGANLPDSPVIAGYMPEDGVTVMMVWTGKWSDGSMAPAMHH